MCNCKKIGKMPRKKNAFGGLVSEVLPITVGMVASGYLNRVTFFSNNPKMGALAKVGIGVLLSGKKGMASGIGLGIAAQGAQELVKDVSGIGLLPAGSTGVYQVMGHPQQQKFVVID